MTTNNPALFKKITDINTFGTYPTESLEAETGSATTGFQTCFVYRNPLLQSMQARVLLKTK